MTDRSQACQNDRLASSSNVRLASSQRLAHLEDCIIAAEVARSQCVGDIDGDVEGRSVLAGLAAAGWEQAEDRFKASIARRVVIAINVIGGWLPTAKDRSGAGGSRLLLPSGSFNSVETVS